MYVCVCVCVTDREGGNRIQHKNHINVLLFNHICCTHMQEGSSPLIGTAHFGQTSVCSLLLEAKANANHVDIVSANSTLFISVARSIVDTVGSCILSQFFFIVVDQHSEL